LGETRKAIDFYEQWLAIAREIGDRRGEGNALWNIAEAHGKLGETATAIEKAKAAFVIRRAIEDPNAVMVAAWLREHGVDPDRL
jgi:tetratricopeptide (TPR) repeat protein